MHFESQYVALTPDEKGYVNYPAGDVATWGKLFRRQLPVVEKRACQPYLNGLKALELAPDKMPQLPELSEILAAQTAWTLKAVPALISAREFFTLLSKRVFPVATFIRTKEELDYVKEPDIFHEVFGHCPMLTNSTYADFLCEYANRVLGFDEKDWPLLQRFFWFTVEFGLIETPKGTKIYGGGILSSFQETKYATDSDIPLRHEFNVVEILRTPYRIDRLQPIYYVIDSFQTLYEHAINDLTLDLKKAHELGEFEPMFEVEDSPSVHIHHC